jgi:hypothetical protein
MKQINRFRAYGGTEVDGICRMMADDDWEIVSVVYLGDDRYDLFFLLDEPEEVADPVGRGEHNLPAWGMIDR